MADKRIVLLDQAQRKALLTSDDHEVCVEALKSLQKDIEELAELRAERQAELVQGNGES